MEYRKLQPSDLSLLEQFFRRLDEMDRERFSPHKADPASLATVLSDARYLPFAALGDNAIAAYFLVTIGMTANDAIRLQPAAITETSVYSLAPAVLAEYRGSGLAAKFLSWIEEYLRKTGAQFLVLQGGVKSENLRAIGFYAKNGFVIASEFFRGTERNCMMYKKL